MYHWQVPQVFFFFFFFLWRQVLFKLSKLFVNSGATDIVLVTLSSTAVERAIAQCTSRWAMARGHRLNTSIVLAAVHGLFRAVSAVEPFTLSPPSHSVPVPNRPTRLCGRKATESKWTSWAVRPNEHSGFRGRKDLLNRASALATTCP